ncbi:MAG: translocation/assembly module TamB domain-containing protein [Selenomonadaceae bacterium]|nr:translocation/assembly module TamB domain-containing protein [Selenomonadaceae bacterium]
MSKLVKVACAVIIAALIAAGLYIHSQRDALFQKALLYAEQEAGKIIGTPVKVGSAHIDEFSLSSFKSNEFVLRDVQILDKNSAVIAKVDEARITFKFLALYDDGAGGIDAITVNGAYLNLQKRGDNSWNFNDIKPKSSGESKFRAKISLANGNVNAFFDDKNIAVSNITADADCSDLSAVSTSLTATVLGSDVTATGIIGSQRQIVNAYVNSVDLAKILPYLPADLIPESVQILGGTASNLVLNVLNRDTSLSYSGSTNFSDGAVVVKNTNISNIDGRADFTDAQIMFNATALANNQPVKALGSVRTDTDVPFFDIRASSDYFIPAAVLPAFGVNGAVNFSARLVGTAADPTVEADISSAFLSYDNISASNISTHLKYQRNAVYLSNLRAETFGGSVSGEMELQAQNFAFNAHLKADGLSLVQLKNFAALDAPVTGNIDADIALNGTASDFSTLKVFGKASSSNFAFQNFLLPSVKSSFLFADNSVTLDYLNLTLPERGKLNIDGTVTNFNSLNLNFYAAHIDLALAKKFNPLVDVSGLSDFRGSISGKLDNPTLKLELTAVHDLRGRHPGVIFNQKYDSIDLLASGSLDGVKVDKFELEKDGKVKWVVIDGTVGLTGDKKINLRLDTVGARTEDIVKVFAPDQELTGNIDNTVRVTGTLDKPNVVGYLEFSYGSYRGFLVNDMRGDYFLEGNKLRLQDFVITSPMVDMVLNGTIDVKTYDMNFVVQGRDVNLKRFQAKFPADYPVEGHGTFEGLIGGNLDAPIFDGRLVSNSLSFNGVELKKILGHVTMNGPQIQLEDFNFRQGDGSYSMQLSANTATKNLNGKVDVKNADIPSLLTLANKKTQILTGSLDSDISISGTFDNPAGTLRGSITNGAIAGHELHDVALDLNLANHVVHVQKFAGKQGDAGEFNVLGTASLSGPLDLTASARHLELAMFSDAAGLDMGVEGFTNLDAKITGSTFNPQGEIKLTANGGIRGANFDLLTAQVSLRDWVFNVRELSARRAIGEKVYQASARGTIPIQALYVDSEVGLSSNEQMNLQVILDDADLSMLPKLSNMVTWAVGEMGGGLTITGTASKPQVNGEISLHDGTVKIKGVESPIEHINISTLFRGNNFNIEQFTGNIGTGTFEVTGGFNFANYALSNYNFTLTADALDIRSAVFKGPLNAEFTISEEKFFNRTFPKLSGVADFDKCTITIPAIPESDAPLPTILLDVTVNLGDKVHFYSSRLYDMFLTGSVKLERSTTHPKTSGIISVKRGGTVHYIQTTFDIREGEAHFNQLDSFFPTLHFNADASVANVKVFLNIDGAIGSDKKIPQIRLSSNPEMSETEIMQLLTLRDAYGNSTSNMSATDILAIGLQMSILGDIEDSVRRSVGLDRFRLNTGSGSALENYSSHEKNAGDTNTAFNIFLGKYISDKIMLRYTQGINGEHIQRYGLQYDFNDNLGVTVEREANEYIFSLEARYKF